MDKINTLSQEALRRYFKTLSQYGYKSYGDVKKLIVLLFIQELLNTPLGDYITEQDYKILQNVMVCLYGSTCLIPYPEYYNDNDFEYKPYLVFRNSEDMNLRYTEQNSNRLVNN